MSQKYKHRGHGYESQTGFYLTDCKYIVLDEGDILLNERFCDEHVKKYCYFLVHLMHHLECMIQMLIQKQVNY